MSVNREPFPGATDTSPANGRHQGLMPRWATASSTIASFATQLVKGHRDIYVPLATTTTAGAISGSDYGLFRNMASCVVYNSTQLVIATGTTTVLTYDSEEFDSNGFHSTSADTGRLTIPAGLAGVYIAFWAGQWDAQSGGGRRNVAIRKNGTTPHAPAETAPNGTTTFPGYAITRLARMAEGDYFDSTGFHDRGSNLAIIQGTSYSPIFGCVRISAIPA